jgi:hypothetical protein
MASRTVLGEVSEQKSRNDNSVLTRDAIDPNASYGYKTSLDE